MIPLKLQLKNFLSYGSDIQTIDFNLYPLICLSGKNGHGKSALLDAITWALWGQARKISGSAKADQGLLRLGQTHMMVVLDFSFNNMLYRVKREFMLTYGKPLLNLDFGVVNEEDHFIPLTDKTISLTQAVIEKTLNLSYESFSNSAFLRQGQSNEFSKKSPKERKDILASILGLDQYEHVKKLALEKVRQLQLDKTNGLALVEKLEQELGKTGALNEQLAHALQKISALALQEQTVTHQAATLAQEQELMRIDQQKNAMLAFQYKQLDTQHQEQESSIRTLIIEWRTIHKKQLLGYDTQTLQEEKAKHVALINTHQQLLQKGLELKEQYLKTKELLQQLEQEIQKKQLTITHQKKIDLERSKHELQTLVSLIQVNAKEQATLELDTKNNVSEQKKLEKLLGDQKKIEEKHNALSTHFERRKEHYQKYLEQGRQLTAELESLEQKKLLAHDDEDPSCPLCEQNLSAARKRFLKTKLVDHEKLIKHRLARITRIVKSLKQLLLDQHKELEFSKKNLEQCNMLAIQQQELEKNHQKITAKMGELALSVQTLRAQQETCEKKIAHENSDLAQLLAQEASLLSSHPEYQTLLAALNSTQQAMKALAYDAAAHKTATDMLAKLEKALAEQSELLAEIGAQEQRKKSISELCTTIKNSKEAKKQFQKEQAAFAQLSAQTEALGKKSAELKQMTTELAKNKESVLLDKTRLETQLATLSQYEKEYRELQNKVTSLNTTIVEYQAIASATGKDGIQALLIEDTIPEIEHEANLLLSRLTHNQSQVFFESLRDLKKGGTKETLDIKISDVSGIRPYEMFSGGEAFRIDFALRIAISKLLARRSGTSLQTLIIDEGFGSQDEEGLGLIMDALYKIQDDFSKIIIVSHLTSMKDQFPVHFVIEKGPQGSTVKVIEQG